jgi:sRNA-binding regulator protein Hfq
MTRTLIKPNLNEIKKMNKNDIKRKPPPPYKTHAENYYYIKQMNNHTDMIIELVSNEKLRGKIEWYDEKCLKLKIDNNDSYIIYKHCIKFMYKNPESATIPQ